MFNNKETKLVSNGEQQDIFAKTFSKLFKENKEKNISDRFSSLSPKKKILAVSAAGAIFGAALPILAAALPFAAAGALTLFFAVKAVEYTFKGLKRSAEKTIEGAEYTAGKVRDGAVYVKDAVKEGYEHSVDSLKRGTHLVNKRVKEKASNVLDAAAGKLHRAAGNENYSDRIDNELISDSPQKRKIQEIKEDFRAIFTDGENNSTLIKSILSGISSKIEEKIAGRTCLGSRDYSQNKEVDRWKQQKRFVDNLDANSLHNLFENRLLDKSKYLKDSTFSEHHNEIKRIIGECKTEHELSSVMEKRNGVAKRHGESRRGSTLSSSLSSSSSLDTGSVSTVSSEAELLHPKEHKKVETATPFLDKVLSSFKGGKGSEKTSEVKYQTFSELDTMPSVEIGNSRFYVTRPKSPRSSSPNSIGAGSTAAVGPDRLRRSNSSNSLNGSPESTPIASPKVPGSALFPNVSDGSDGVQYRYRGNGGLFSRSASVSNIASNSSYHSTVGFNDNNDSVSKNSFLSHRSGSLDNGMSSGSSILQKLNLSSGNLSEARSKLRQTSFSDKLFAPSTKLVDTDAQQRSKKSQLKA